MTRLAVDLAALDDLLQRMARFELRLSSAHDEADHRVRQLSASWTGDAAQAYAAAHSAWSSGASEARDALAVITSVLATAHANYSAAVAANRRMWAR